jgi:hypothetical protein
MRIRVFSILQVIHKEEELTLVPNASTKVQLVALLEKEKSE